MTTSSFKMTQADTAGRDWQVLSFRSHMVKSEDRSAFTDPLIARVFADELDYGKLFVYCFRRFGYPDRGWDDYKQLVSYHLTTPHPDLILAVTPYVGGTSSIALRFLVGYETALAVQDYARREGTVGVDQEHSEPDLVSEWLSLYINEKQYSHIEARSPLFCRPTSIDEWSNDDPLKPLAWAAISALEDLLSPVPVRDQHINVLGPVEDPDQVEQDDGDFEVECVDVAASAGYPSGSLGNYAPDEYSELHRVVLALGGGDPKAGIMKAIASIEKGQGAAL